MGTTVVGALFSPRKRRMFIGHVGDSRAYRIRGGAIQQLTRDHSLFNDYLAAMPDLTEEQRNEIPKNVITRALGMQEQVAVDLQSDEVRPGDVFVLCSDGLSGMLEDEDILMVAESTTDLQEACRQMVALANEHGGEDNITALLVRIEVEPGLLLEPSAEPPESEEAWAETPRAGRATPAPTSSEEEG